MQSKSSIHPETLGIKVKDLGLASFLASCNGVSLIRTHRDEKNIVYFIFSPKDKVQGLIDSYFNGDAPSIQPRILFNKRRDLQDFIFQGINKNDENSFRRT